MTWKLMFTACPFGPKHDLTAWKRGIASAAQEALLISGLKQPDRAIRIEAEFRFRRPKSTKATARPTSRPDVEQLTKLVNSSLSGIIYPSKRSGLPVGLSVGKDYAIDAPYVQIVITEVA